MHIRIAAACICGSDLWPYRGVDSVENAPMGHEYVGVVEEIGSAVGTIRVGDFVVGSFFASDNTCEICRAGYQSHDASDSHVGRMDTACMHEPGGVTEDDVRRFCLALPDVTERISWERPAWFARTLMARMWDDDVLTVKTTEREALAATQPETFFWTPHHDRSPRLVLVRLPNLTHDELAELLTESHRLANLR